MSAEASQASLPQYGHRGLEPRTVEVHREIYGAGTTDARARVEESRTGCHRFEVSGADTDMPTPGSPRLYGNERSVDHRIWSDYPDDIPYVQLLQRSSSTSLVLVIIPPGYPPFIKRLLLDHYARQHGK